MAHKDTLNEGAVLEENEVVMKTSISSSVLNAPRRGENEQIQKLKKELERVESTYEKQLALHEKEMNILGDRCHKLDYQLQASIKEKNSLATTSVAKDREIEDLKHRQGLLRNKLDKAEKASLALKEKHAQSEVLQKKVDDLSKQQERFKQSSKISHESESLKAELKSLRSKLDHLTGEKQSLSALIDQLKSDRKVYKARNLELNSTIITAREEWQSKEAKLKEESKELGKRLIQQQETIVAQKNDFTSAAQGLNTAVSELENSLNLERSSFDHQKQAYLGRINQLETDLDVIERDLLEKDRQLESARSKLQETQNKIHFAENESSSVKSQLVTLRNQFDEQKAYYETALSEKMAQLEECITEKDLQQKHFETLLESLQNTADELQMAQKIFKSKYEEELMVRDQSIDNITKKLNSKSNEVQNLTVIISEKAAEFSSLQERHASATQTAELKIVSLQKSLSLAHKDIESSQKGCDRLEACSKEQTAKIAELESTLESTKLGLNRLDSDKFEFQQRIIELQGMLESSKNHTAEVEAKLRKEVSTLNGKLEASFQECSLLNNQKTFCENAITQLELDLQTQCETANSTKASLKDALKVRESTIAELQSKLQIEKSEHEHERGIFKTEVAVLEESVRQSRIEVDELSLKLRQSFDSKESMEKLYRNEEESYASHRKRYESQIADKDDVNQKLRDKIVELTKQLEEQALNRELMTTTSKRTQSEMEAKLSLTEQKLSNLQSEASKSRELLREAYIAVDDMEVRMRDWEEKACISIDSSNEYHFLAEQRANIIRAQEEALKECSEDIQLLREENLSQDLLISNLECLVDQLLPDGSNYPVDTETEDPLISQFEHREEFLDLLSDSIKCQSDLELSTKRLLTSRAEVSELQNFVLKSEDRLIACGSYLSDITAYATNLWESLSVVEDSLENEMELRASAQDTIVKLELSLSESNRRLEDYSVEQNELVLELQRQNANHISEISFQASKIADLNSEFQTLTSMLTASSQSNSELGSQLEAKTEECQKLFGSLSNLESTHKMILEELNLTKAELDDFKLHADKKIAKQLAELEELQEEAFKLNENLVYESVCYSKLNESYLTVQKDNAEIKRINDDLKDSCDRLTGQIVIMEQKVKAIQNQNEEAYQLLENELNNAQTASGEKDRIIANLQESLTKSSNLFEEERENHLYEIEQLNFSHENAVKISESVFEDLKKDWASIKSEFDDFQSRAEEAATSSALREESLQQKLIDLEVSSNMKDDEIRTVQSKLSELNIRAEKSISDLQASLCSAEKQYQEALKLVQQEKAQIMKNSLSEKATFLKKTAELNEIIDLQSSDISKLQSRLSEAEDNLLSMKNNAKIELGNLNNENSKLASKLDSEIKCSEKIVQDLAARLAEKSSQMMSLESKVLELENINERSEIRLSNEVSNRDLMIKHLESKLRESTKTLDLVRIECSAIKTEFQKFKDHTGATIEAKVEAQVQAATNELLRENTELEQKVSERADDEIALIQEIDSLKLKLAEILQIQANEKENFDLQLQLLEQRGKLQKNEIKKIGDLNAELFGHSNTRQKIKHVAQLKEENMTLREQNLLLSRERDTGRRKLMALQRELEQFKQLGISSNRKMSRVGRAVLDSNKILDGSERKTLPKPIDSEDLSKENVSLNLGNGGISFVVE